MAGLGLSTGRCRQRAGGPAGPGTRSLALVSRVVVMEETAEGCGGVPVLPGLAGQTGTRRGPARVQGAGHRGLEGPAAAAGPADRRGLTWHDVAVRYRSAPRRGRTPPGVTEDG